MEPWKYSHVPKTMILFLISTTLFKMVLCYSAIYSFGDSYIDTGNRLISDPSVIERVGHLPYGETFFHRPTGRYSDGRLVIDYLAEDLGMPFVPPSFGNSSIGGGLNYAVSGATALPTSFFKTRNISIPTIYSLERQIDFFLYAKKEFCTSYNKDCDVHFERALFFMGEFGKNDYSHSLSQNYTLQDLEAFVEPLLDTIIRSLTRLIELGGARNILIENLPPDGCLPATLSQAKNDEKRDKMGCLQKRNEFFKRSNRAFEKKLLGLRRSFPHVNLVLLDYYEATMTLLLNRSKYGMKDGILEACCGVRGLPYNVNRSLLCGFPETTACPNPNEHFSWDGIHFTDAANDILAHLMLENITFPNASRWREMSYIHRNMDVNSIVS